MPEKKTLASYKAAPLEPQMMKLPARPTFEKKPETKEEEHRRRQKAKGRYRAIKDLGEPTHIQEAGNDSPIPKR
jgi:hypothetical protein